MTLMAVASSKSFWASSTKTWHMALTPLLTVYCISLGLFPYPGEPIPPPPPSLQSRHDVKVRSFLRKVASFSEGQSTWQEAAPANVVDFSFFYMKFMSYKSVCGYFCCWWCLLYVKGPGVSAKGNALPQFCLERLREKTKLNLSP